MTRTGPLATASGMWDSADLMDRVLRALDLTVAAVCAALRDDPPSGRPGKHVASDREPDGSRSEVVPLVRGKVLGEAALLVRSVAPVAGIYPTVAARAGELARLVRTHAGGTALAAAVCLRPALALDEAFPHILLRDLGYHDHAADQLLDAVLDAEAGGQPERLPTRELEQMWLRQIWDRDCIAASRESEVLDRSYLAAPLDALGMTSHDIYSFTHLVLYATDDGRRSPTLRRPLEDVVADAEAALAAALDCDNLDLTAEVLWTWPMLDLPWSPAATFALTTLADAQDALGFLPGPGFRRADHDALPEDCRERYVLRSSYHTTLVMGMLCAVAVRPGRTPPTRCRSLSTSDPCAADALFAHIQRTAKAPRWEEAYRCLDDTRRAGLEGLLRTVALRRARYSSDLGAIRELLVLALQHGLTDGPAVQQAVCFLRRSTLLAISLHKDAVAAEDVVATA